MDKTAETQAIKQLIKKMNWFIIDVCQQAFTRLTGAIFGNSLFAENNMFYHCTYLKDSLGIFFNGIFVMLVAVSIINTAWKQRNFCYVVIAIVAIPLSFYPFLILPESIFITYYAIGIILLFLWYVFDGIMVIVNLVKSRLEGRYKLFNMSGDVLVGILVMIVSLRSNAYAENVWANYLRDAYEYLANSIMSELNNNNDINTIIVRGNMGEHPGGGHDYVVTCVDDILREMGYETSAFQIVQIENGYYPLIVTDTEAAKMEQMLGKKLKDEVLAYYGHDDMYERWIILGDVQSDSEKEFLKECFIKTGIMIDENESENAISISMDGFNIRNTF